MKSPRCQKHSAGDVKVHISCRTLEHVARALVSARVYDLKHALSAHLLEALDSMQPALELLLEALNLLVASIWLHDQANWKRPHKMITHMLKGLDNMDVFVELRDLFEGQCLALHLTLASVSIATLSFVPH